MARKKLEKGKTKFVVKKVKVVSSLRLETVEVPYGNDTLLIPPRGKTGVLNKDSIGKLPVGLTLVAVN